MTSSSLSEKIKRELSSLMEEVETLRGFLDKLESERIVAFGTAYQSWYTRALKLVESLAPDRVNEFIGYYRIDPKRKALNAATYVIQDFVNGYGPVADVFGKKPFDELILT
jgi:hypothetical protein